MLECCPEAMCRNINITMKMTKALFANVKDFRGMIKQKDNLLIPLAHRKPHLAFEHISTSLFWPVFTSFLTAVQTS